ncbi:type III secretion system protein SctP [Duganella sp.]|uniref:type III secretion system protein SctP n=1 Tax=Duganella sp. TaxID=1904440 RepID=UPI0031D8824F
MAIKPPDTQPVRLLGRSMAPAIGSGRQRALRLQFRASMETVQPAGDHGEVPGSGEDVTATAAVEDAGTLQQRLTMRMAADLAAQLPPAVAPVLPPAPECNEPALSPRIARACALDEQEAMRTARLASVIAQFCNAPSIMDSGNWELQIAIDPALLPATRLYLHLSSCRLLLRFESADHQARSVIWDHSKELQQRLSALLPARIEVDIVCW